jgi:hypothetical protein
MSELLLVGGIVALALAYTLRHFMRARRGGGCGCGRCDCGAADERKPAGCPGK